MSKCYECIYCIEWRGQDRCGRAETSYKEINKFDDACDEFKPFDEEDEEL